LRVGFTVGLLVRPGPVVVPCVVGEPGGVVGLPVVGVGLGVTVATGGCVRAGVGDADGVRVWDPDGIGVAVGCGLFATSLGVTVGCGFDSGRAAFGTGMSGVCTDGPPRTVLTSRPR
jgi:hypothetical protein